MPIASVYCGGVWRINSQITRVYTVHGISCQVGLIRIYTVVYNLHVLSPSRALILSSLREQQKLLFLKILV